MKVKLVDKKEEAKGTKSFYFEKLDDFEFLPGQYIYLTLPKLIYPDPRGATRHFTISLSPTEVKDRIRITCRVREESGFKKTLDELPLGSMVQIEGPSGTFIFDEKTIDRRNGVTNHILLAGGIGITPFRSFLKYTFDKKLGTFMHLIYSNNNDDFPFKKDFDEMTQEDDYIKTLFFNSSKSGHLDKNAILGILEKWKLKKDACTFWVVGPPAFVSAMEDVLESLKIPSSHLITEKFTGY